MAGLFKKALSVFVEFDEDANNSSNVSVSRPSASVTPSYTAPSSGVSKISLNHDEIEKFEKHFETLMTESNIPGPDYFEF